MNYPLLLDYQSTIIGNGFIAEVQAAGRLLACHDDGEWWLYGVNPSTIAEYGETLPEANDHFRDAVRAVLINLAEESPDLESFQASVDRFFQATNEPNLADWAAAVARVRANNERLSNLDVKSAERSVSVRVTRKHVEESPAFEADINLLPEKPADRSIGVTVTQKLLTSVRASDNAANTQLAKAA